MAVYFITGKLGNGKSLAAVGKLRDYLEQGRPVATNLDIYCEHFRNKKNRDIDLKRLPDKPMPEHMYQLGYGNTTYDEGKNGGIFLDECGTWFNSRNWNDAGRKELNDWFLHARKYGWDLFFIVQDISIIDKQARETLCEHLVVCRRLDNINVPFLGTIFKLITGKRWRLPKVHSAKVHYGDNEQALCVDRWVYRGTDLYKLYDTKQIFTSEERGIASMLSPWHLVGRYMTQKTIWDYLNLLLPVLRPIIALTLLITGAASPARRVGVAAHRSTAYFIDRRTRLPGELRLSLARARVLSMAYKRQGNNIDAA